MQRLPGGFWQWIGRVNYYNGTPGVTSKTTITASIFERVALILTGISSYLIVYNLWLGLLSIIIIYTVLVYWKQNAYNRRWKSFIFTLFHIFSYMISWLIGAAILLIIIGSVKPTHTFTLMDTISIWTLTGTITLIFFFLPGGLGVKEVSLSALLMPQLTFSQTILTALILRLLFLLLDVLTGIFGLLLTQIGSKRVKLSKQLSDKQ